MFTCLLATSGFWSRSAQDVILQGLAAEIVVRPIAFRAIANWKAWSRRHVNLSAACSRQFSARQLSRCGSRRRNPHELQQLHFLAEKRL